MPSALYSIGDNDFLDMAPPPDFPKERLQLEERPGVDGTGLWGTGYHGRPCTVRTRADAPSAAEAMTKFAQYLEAIESDPVDVTFAGQDLTTLGVKYQVLDVRAVYVGALAIAVGGLEIPDGSAGGWIEAEWDLLPIPQTDDEET